MASVQELMGISFFSAQLTGGELFDEETTSPAERKELCLPTLSLLFKNTETQPFDHPRVLSQ